MDVGLATKSSPYLTVKRMSRTSGPPFPSINQFPIANHPFNQPQKRHHNPNPNPHTMYLYPLLPFTLLVTTTYASPTSLTSLIKKQLGPTPICAYSGSISPDQNNPNSIIHNSPTPYDCGATGGMLIIRRMAVR